MHIPTANELRGDDSIGEQDFYHIIEGELFILDSPQNWYSYLFSWSFFESEGLIFFPANPLIIFLENRSNNFKSVR